MRYYYLIIDHPPGKGGWEKESRLSGLRSLPLPPLNRLFYFRRVSNVKGMDYG
jgi:hypothetical protein